MGGNEFLIPANSKKSMLILGFFNTVDLIIFITGAVLTFLLLFIIDTNNLKQALFIIAPIALSAFLVIPIPNHHNIRTFIGNVYIYYSNRKTYYWRGWCLKRGEE